MATQVSDASSKTRVRGGSSDELAVIAQRAQAFTNASGTAIALSEGNADEIVCRARAGSSAPEVGTALRVEGTFTGLCIQSGKELRCDDAETDTRVDTAAIRALGIRSMVVIPIKEEGRVVGVLAVFAPTAHAFTITHVAVLKTMADQIAAYLQRKSRDEGSSPEPLPAAPVKAVAVAASASPVLPPAVVIKPAAPSSGPRQLPVVPKVEPVRASVVAEEVVPAQPPKKKKANGRDEQKEPKIDFRPSFGTLDTAAAAGRKPSANILMIGAAAGVVIVAIGGLSFYTLRKPAAAAPQQTQEASSSPAAPPASASTQPAVTIAASSSPSTPSTPISSATLAPSNPELAKKNDKALAKNTPPAPSAKHEEAQPKHEEAQPKREEAQPKREETVALSAGPSRISGARDNPAPAAEAPAMALGSVPASGSLSNLASPVSASTPSILTQSDLEPVTVLKRVAPMYPLVAKQRRLSGSVVVQGTVDKNGKITNLQLVSGPPLFRDAAFDAVKQWVFKPARLNGQPIEQPTQIRLDFGAQ